MLLSNGWEMRPMRVAVTAMVGSEMAPSGGRINILEWLSETGHDIAGYPLCQHEAESGNIECLMFAHGHGCLLVLPTLSGINGCLHMSLAT